MRLRRHAWASVCSVACAALTSILLIACAGGGSSGMASHHAHNAAAVATVPYLPPTIIPVTPRPTNTPTPRPTPPHAAPAPTAPTPVVPPGPNPNTSVPHTSGQLLLVSLSQQWLWAYQAGQLVYRTPITSGMPELPTPDGIFQIQFHIADLMFISPWPPGSPYYYAPEHVNYAMYFLAGGYYVHDAPWRKSYFGPGTNYPHVDPDGVTRTGSHGCVEVPTPAGAWLYNWTNDGTTLDIYGTAPVPPAATPTPTLAPTHTPSPTDTPTATPTDTPSTDRAGGSLLA